MRKEYDFSGGVRGSVSGGRRIIKPRKVKAGRTISDDDAPLSAIIQKSEAASWLAEEGEPQ